MEGFLSDSVAFAIYIETIRRHLNPELYSVAVVPVDVVVQHLHERSIVLVVVFVPVELLLLEKPEEVLGHGVVEAVDLPRHRLSYPVVCEPRLIQLVLILPALVGMQYRFALADDSGLGELIQHVPLIGDTESSQLTTFYLTF